MQAIPVGLRVAPYRLAVAVRRIAVDQIVGAAEIADRMNLQFAQTVHDWRRRYDDFPEPVARLKMGFVWNWPDVERWLRATGRLR